eukprot:360016-Chlamydomonas_euryale.AAC.3
MELRQQLTRLAGGCGRCYLHPRTKRQPGARGAYAGRHSSVLRASTGSHPVREGPFPPGKRSK